MWSRKQRRHMTWSSWADISSEYMDVMKSVWIIFFFHFYRSHTHLLSAKLTAEYFTFEESLSTSLSIRCLSALRDSMPWQSAIFNHVFYESHELVITTACFTRGIHWKSCASDIVIFPVSVFSSFHPNGYPILREGYVTTIQKHAPYVQVGN